MKKYSVLIALLCLCPPALAQPIESEPLKPFVPYTLKGETDPMALGSGASSVDSAGQPNRPPIQDAIPAQPVETAPIIPAPAPAPASETSFPPAPAPVSSPSATAPATYLYNDVAAPPKQSTDTADKMFCTLKISFTSMAAGVDGKTGKAVKTYLDGNGGKLGYVRTNWGREGEYDYCIDIPDHKNRSAVYQQLKVMVRNGRATAPVIMTGKGFAEVSSKRKLQN